MNIKPNVCVFKRNKSMAITQNLFKKKQLFLFWTRCSPVPCFFSKWSHFVYLNRFLKRFREKCCISSPFNCLRNTDTKTQPNRHHLRTNSVQRMVLCSRMQYFLKRMAVTRQKTNISLRKMKFVLNRVLNAFPIFMERNIKSFEWTLLI